MIEIYDLREIEAETLKVKFFCDLIDRTIHAALHYFLRLNFWLILLYLFCQKCCIFEVVQNLPPTDYVSRYIRITHFLTLD